MLAVLIALILLMLMLMLMLPLSHRGRADGANAACGGGAGLGDEGRGGAEKGKITATDERQKGHQLYSTPVVEYYFTCRQPCLRLYVAPPSDVSHTRVAIYFIFLVLKKICPSC